MVPEYMFLPSEYRIKIIHQAEGFTIRFVFEMIEENFKIILVQLQ